MNQNKRISPLFNQCLSIVMAVALVATWIVPARVDAQDTYPVHFGFDPLGLIANYDVTSYYTTKPDVVEVWICTIGTKHTLTNLTVEQLTEGLRQSGLAEYFESMSGGRYEMSFVPGGVVDAAFVQGCHGDQTFGGTSAILAVPDLEDGFGWSPRFLSFSTDYPWNRRSAAIGFYDGVRGINIASTAKVFGFTFPWPQSYTGALSPESGLTRADNPMDMTSRGNRGVLRVGTIAANRYASGWIAPEDVHIYEDGHDLVTLSVDWEAGTQMIVLPTETQGNFLSLGARVAKRHDWGIPKEGVEAYVIEQVLPSCRFGYLRPLLGEDPPNHSLPA